VDLGKVVLFEDGVGTLDFFVQSNFGSDPLRPYLVLEIERFASFRSQSDRLGVVLLLGVAKKLFKGMFIGHRLFSRSELAGQSWLTFGSESMVGWPSATINCTSPCWAGHF